MFKTKKTGLWLTMAWLCLFVGGSFDWVVAQPLTQPPTVFANSIALQGDDAAPEEAQTPAEKPPPEAEPQQPVAAEETSPPSPEAEDAAVEENPEQAVEAPVSSGEVAAEKPVESEPPLPLQEGFVPFFKPDVTLGSLITTDKPLVRLLRRIAREHQLKLFVDGTIDIEVTLLLDNPRSSLNQLLNVLIHLYPIRCERIGDFVYVHRLRDGDQPKNMVLFDPLEHGLAFELEEMSLERLIRDLMEISGVNIRVQESFVDRQTQLSGYQTWLPFEKALAGLLAPFGYGVREREGVYHIGRVQGVTIHDDLIDIWYESTPLETILRELSEKGNYPIMFLDQLEGEVSLDIRGVTLENLLDLLLADARYSYRKQGDVHLIGQGDTASYYETAIIRYEAAHASLILDLLPELPEHFTEGIKVILLKEHNSLMITGEPQRVDSLSEVLRALDRPVAQVLLEVLVVQYNVEDTFELGLQLNAGDGQELFPNIQNLTFTGFRDNHGSYRIARLPSDFTVKLNALQQKGKVRVITKPHVATLSGNEAALVIGTTLSYKVSSEELVGNDNPRVRTTEAIQTVDANTNLTITPWVMGDDLLTVDILSEFNTFDGAVVDNVPPAQNVSMIRSKVRLRDGETIILGGLIVDSQSLDREGVPLLSKIPVLGALFRNRKKVTKLNERVIYITPHVYYGDEASAEFVRDSSELDYRLQSDWEERRRRRAKKREQVLAKRKAVEEARPAAPEKPREQPNPTDMPKFLSGDRSPISSEERPQSFSTPEEETKTAEPPTEKGDRSAGWWPLHEHGPPRTRPYWDDETPAKQVASINQKEPESDPASKGEYSPQLTEMLSVNSVKPVVSRRGEPSKPFFAAELVPVNATSSLSMPVSLLPTPLRPNEPRRRLRKPTPSRKRPLPLLARQDQLESLAGRGPLIENHERPSARGERHQAVVPSLAKRVSLTSKPSLNRPVIASSEKIVTQEQPSPFHESITSRLALAMFRPEQPYSIVFMAKCSRPSLIRFLENHPEAEVGVVPRKLKGQPCFLLTWGAFTSHKHAIRMQSQLPRELKFPGEKPWVLNLHPKQR